MSLRLHMLQVARLAPKILGESASLVREFLLCQQNADGAFQDRTGQGDLYYTVFGLDGLMALQAELPWQRIEGYLRSFAGGEGLDFVHRCCLARAWGTVRHFNPAATFPEKQILLGSLEEFRTQDGGYHPNRHGRLGTAYGAFLALGAYQDLGVELPAPLDLVRALQPLQTADGGWANEAGIQWGATNATAAVISVLRELGAPVTPKAGQWLLDRCHPAGGFLAAPNTPWPDLLSTATALHALAGLQVPFEHVKESCLDFIDSLWTNEGAFYGHWGDNAIDCEYTYYGLLALGHLSL